jgi:hypothetical protein
MLLAFLDFRLESAVIQPMRRKCVWLLVPNPLASRLAVDSSHVQGWGNTNMAGQGQHRSNGLLEGLADDSANLLESFFQHPLSSSGKVDMKFNHKQILMKEPKHPSA